MKTGAGIITNPPQSHRCPGEAHLRGYNVRSVTGFDTRENILTCDGLALGTIAERHGTPTHVYSRRLLSERVTTFDEPFASIRHRVHYALKANSTLAIVRHMRSLGTGADVNSGGEIEVALRAGFAPADMVFTGVGKSPDELRRALDLNVLAINAESFGEIERIAALAGNRPHPARIAIRINPDVEAGSHPHISTGSKAAKFGVSLADAPAMIRDVVQHPALRLVGLHVHIGSQLVTAEPLKRAASAIAGLARDVLAQGVPLEHLDLGGGLGVAYKPDDPTMSPTTYATTIIDEVRSLGLTLLLEPGRWLVAPAGCLLTRVVDLKPKPGGGWFVIVDAGMTDLMRPALYAAFHQIEPIAPRPGDPIRADIVGPVCETTDTLGVGRTLPPVEVGDVLAIRDTGAYGSVMASNYNRRPIAAEVMIEDGEARVIRRRQTVDDMLQWDL